MSWHHQMPKHETRNILMNNLRRKDSQVMLIDANDSFANIYLI